MNVSAPTPAEQRLIRILHLEDSAFDAELIADCLDALPGLVRIERVWTRQDFTAAVTSGEHDLILADYSLPAFDGERALEIAHAVAPDIPFIFVSGTLGEDVAVDALKRGATDYVVKRGLHRLPSAVERALAEARERRELRQTQAALAASETRYRQIVESARDFAIVTLDLAGRVSSWNRGAEQIFGFREDEVLGHPASMFFTAEDRLIGAPEQELAAAREHGRVESERWHVRKSGTRFWASGMTTPLLDERTGPHAQPLGFLKIVSDRTEQRTAHEALRKSEAELRLVSDAVPALVCYVDPAFRYRFCNRAYEEWFGIRREEAVGRTLTEVLGEKAFEVLEPIARRALKGERIRHETRVPYEQGARDVHIDYVPDFGDAGGGVRGFYAFVQDVSERKAAEVRLRESEARFRNLADNAPVMIWVTEPDGHCSYLSRSWLEFTGQTLAGGMGLGWLEAVHADDFEYAKQVFLAANAKQEPLRLEYRLRRRDGTYRWALDAAVPRFGEAGEFLGYVGSVIDIDERREAEERLRVSKERYRMLFEAIEAGFCIVEIILDAHGAPADYRFIEVNPAFQHQTGLHDALGRTAREVVPALEPWWIETYGRVALTGEPVRFENGSVPMGRWFDVHAFRIGRPRDLRVAILFNDISARKRNEQQLKVLNETLELRVADALAERKLFADLVEGTDALVQVVDPDYRWLAVNRAAADEFERIYGKRPRVGASMLELLADRPQDQAAMRAMWERVLSGEEISRVYELGDPRKVRRSYETKGSVLRDRDGRLIGAYMFAQDVSDRLRDQQQLLEAQEALRQSQKMETLGQLTGGVAHDFNNLLTPIVGALDALKRKLEGDARATRMATGALQSAERAKTLVDRLLSFARRQTLAAHPVDVTALILDMRDLIARSLGPTINVQLDLPADLPPAHVDPNQLELAILNLAVNARDAMLSGGVLRIQAASEAVTRANPAHLAPGRFIRLSVSDTGIGMDEETASKAIEPFFTTKDVGLGTGLGLSMVHGFTAQLGGGMSIRSEVGKGTCVDLWLPIASAPHGEVQAALEPDEIAPATPALVLLVDDEDLVRAATAEMLHDGGYGVIEAASASAAIELAKAGAEFEVVVTDQLMPGMKGTELANELKRIRPDVPVLLVSGYTQATDLELPRLAKPFRPSELIRKLQELLRDRQ